MASTRSGVLLLWVADEMARCLGVVHATVSRDDADDAHEVAAHPIGRVGPGSDSGGGFHSCDSSSRLYALTARGGTYNQPVAPISTPNSAWALTQGASTLH